MLTYDEHILHSAYERDEDAAFNEPEEKTWCYFQDTVLVVSGTETEVTESYYHEDNDDEPGLHELGYVESWDYRNMSNNYKNFTLCKSSLKN